MWSSMGFQINKYHQGGIIVQGRMNDDNNIYFKAPSSTGWWFQPLWKILVSQLGWKFPIYGNIKHVPNHQPENVYLDGFTKQQMGVSINGYLPLIIHFFIWFFNHDMNHSFLGVAILETPRAPQPLGIPTSSNHGVALSFWLGLQGLEDHDPSILVRYFAAKKVMFVGLNFYH